MYLVLLIFCYRRSKIESEVKIKQASMTLLEMKFFFNTKKGEMEQIQETMDQLLLLRNQYVFITIV